MGNKQARSYHAAAVITGAGSGIGRAFALELARRGGEIICADINLSAAEDTVQRIEAAGGRAYAVNCDVRELAQVEALAEQAETLLDRPVELLINNAGVGAGGKPVGSFSMDDWRWVIDINLWGVIHGCHVFAPRLLQGSRGGIINVASTASFSAAPLMAAYNTSKAGVLALSETLAAEWAATPLAVTALCPTVVRTNIFRDGRIDPSTQSVTDRWIKWTGMSPEKVVTRTLAVVDRGELYVMPQWDARLIWRSKRFTPRTYQVGTGLLSRMLTRKAGQAA